MNVRMHTETWHSVSSFGLVFETMDRSIMYGWCSSALLVAIDGTATISTACIRTGAITQEHLRATVLW